MYRAVKRSVAETDPVHSELEQVLRYDAGVTSLKNGLKYSYSGAEIVPKVAFLV